ncbi:hypothetical protein FJ959_22145 [Mesorhizobium sp. B2-2-4]|uniref:recombination protein NinB n=1 Tax=unclassified Mesorhizobium TaxID=325217 RepID=UPI00112D8373|nr:MULTISPECIES: recombination protein NinB [unclassified Mesorhizobium]TPM53236.1 hypothetical protein FJ959_22145 [Mesorhizobium sp. B2-2-4]TPM62122.1 hypothetical protein FJ965_21225 [Mesorhizobium sp. B2-2-1]TPN68493.1 hypothetical protein FJ984_11705 [Mesorhizobium sp. B1-1-3]
MGRALLVLNTEADRQKAAHWVSKAPWGTRIEFKASKRSLPQNDRLWAMLTDVAAHMKALGRDYTTEEWKLLFMSAWGREIRFLPGLDQKTFVPVGQSSSDLSKQEMTDLIEFIYAWGAENGVTFNDPKEQEPSADGSSVTDDGSGVDAPHRGPAADQSEPASGGPAEAGDMGAREEPDALPASNSLSDEDKAFLVRVFKTMKAAVGPELNVFKRQALVFTDEIGGKSNLVRAKATKIRTELERCCGDEPAAGTVEVGKYLAGIIGVDAAELAD